MVAFLIDADNLASPAYIDEAFQTLERTEGPVAIRRYVNLALSKNTTDLSLAVDAMELACLE